MSTAMTTTMSVATSGLHPETTSKGHAVGFKNVELDERSSVWHRLTPKNGSRTTASLEMVFDDNEEVDILIKPETTKIVMALDDTPTGLYVLYYYLQKLHRPSNQIYAVFVSDDFRSVGPGDSNDSKEAKETQVGKKRCCPRGTKTVQNALEVGPSPGVLAGLRKQDRVRCMKVKHRVKHLLSKNDVEWSFRRLRSQDPGKAINDYRQEVGADMIIIGSRGAGFVGRTLQGSVSTKVLHQSLVPVLVIRKPQGALEVQTINRETTVG